MASRENGRDPLGFVPSKGQGIWMNMVVDAVSFKQGRGCWETDKEGTRIVGRGLFFNAQLYCPLVVAMYAM